MYGEKIKKNFVNPKNAGRPSGANASAKLITENGDVIKIFFKVNEYEVVEDAKFKAFGGPVTIAALNVVCEIVIDKTLEDCLKIMDYDIFNELEKVPEKNIPDIINAKNVVKMAVENYYIKKEKELKKLNKI
ncbi:MAG: iron-sulfur cluster assembly scaffold protein [Clostridia bacterium]|jgi:nitrogen fixation NifU-like protein|nr:iron-sulfur cluster assembly scaffold protein [Clostridia bacterium]MDD3231877.1 iron-sulfur cluster assembly scaffold protein [Clostridia bacterium]MDD3862360.1 iron-sulfur cluster assembly scaffold protein [Clostridia bacterium]MDD4408538.1 iron-sulfur cluster assembly scaffold protein [Clostridia bacterium]